MERKNPRGLFYQFIDQMPHTIFISLYPLILTAFFQSLSYGQIEMSYFIISSMALGGLIFILFTFTNNLFFSGVFISTSYFIFHLVNYYRFELTGEFFTPKDLTMAKNLGAIFSFGKDLALEPKVIILIILFIILHIFLYHFSRAVYMDLKKRMILFSVALTFFLALGNATFFTKDAIPTATLYEKKGPSIGFMKLFFERILPESQISLITDDLAIDFLEKLEYEAQKYRKQQPTPKAKKPDVIVIMSEAFTHPGTWTNASITKEVTPNFNRLMKDYPQGTMITPAMGGGTCNPEYEFLTGNPLFTLPGEVFPFEEPDKYIPEDYKRALPYVFKQNGYATIGIHPYEENFFNRRLIYPRLGFDSFVAMENMIASEVELEDITKGIYISDDYFIEQIINTHKHATDPVFIYGISMENHYGYFIEKFMIRGEFPEDVFDVDVYVSGLDTIERGYVKSYLQGLYDADKALGDLTAYLEKSDRPTMVLFFGDHQPLLGPESHKVMYHLGQTVDNEPFAFSSLESQFNMYQTPYLFWANFDLAPIEYEYLSPYYFGPILLEQAGLFSNRYFELLSPMKDVLPAGKQYLFVDPAGNYHQQPTENMNPLIDALSRLQAKYLSGEDSKQEHLTP